PADPLGGVGASRSMRSEARSELS
ncbi:MAG: hypothetical protein JWO86_7874, partial [Myxococcaceae bacterium]|nr:hypothetical protein [Myxococcaceae bacterium]